MSKKTVLALAAGGAMMMAAGAATADQIKIEGTITYHVADVKSQPAAGGGSILRQILKGMIIDEDPTSPINFSAQDCAGTYVLRPEGGMAAGGGFCDVLDKDGHIWWLRWNTTGERTSEWTVTGGLGKYAGMTGQGTTRWLAQVPDGRSVLQYEGTLNLQ